MQSIALAHSRSQSIALSSQSIALGSQSIALRLLSIALGSQSIALRQRRLAVSAILEACKPLPTVDTEALVMQKWHLANNVADAAALTSRA